MSLWDEPLDDPFAQQRDPNATTQATAGLQPNQPQATPQVQPAPQATHTPNTTGWTGGFTGQGGPTAPWEPSWTQGQPSQQAPQSSPQPGAASRDVEAYRASAGYRQQIDAIRAATDPAQQAQLRDKLSRDLFSSLKSSGHDVKWQGDQLLVDGRLYDVGGGADGNLAGDHVALPARPTGGAYAGQLSGFDATKLGNADHNTPKYVFARIAQNYDVSDPAQRQAMLEALRADPSGYFANATLGGSKGDKLIIGGALDPKFEGIGSFDVVQAAGEGGRNWQWLPEGQGGSAGAGAVGGGTGFGVPSYASLGSYGGGAAMQPITSTYAPNQVDYSDLPNFTFESLLKQLQQTSPMEDKADRFVSDYLDNPFSLDDRTIEMLKARSKDELAAQQARDEDDMTSFGFQSGIAGSPWLKAQQAASRVARDNAVVASNRNVDLTAAQTRGAEKQAAASLGASYAGQKASQRAQAVSTAMEGALSKSSQIGSRQGLQASIDQAAAQLKMSAAQLTQQYVIAKMQDMTQRYGIDVGADIDWARLGQADSQFLQELAFRLYSFDKGQEQNDRQFGANLGLNYAQLQWLMDQAGMNWMLGAS